MGLKKKKQTKFCILHWRGAMRGALRKLCGVLCAGMVLCGVLCGVCDELTGVWHVWMGS